MMPSRTVYCHQCKSAEFRLVYESIDRVTTAVCSLCDAPVAVIDPPPSRPLASSTTYLQELDLPPDVTEMVGQAGLSEGGGPIHALVKLVVSEQTELVWDEIMELRMRMNEVEKR